MTMDEVRLILLAPGLAAIDAALPGLAWDAYHGDDAALRELAAALKRRGRREQAEQVLEILRPADPPADER